MTRLDGERLLQWLEVKSLDLLAVAVILAVGVWLSRRLSAALERVLNRVGADSTVSGFLRYLSYAALLVVTGIIALQQFGVPVTSIIAVLGAAGLAIALAMKDSLSNIAAGIMLIVLRPFREGDFVQVASQEGTIEQIRVFQTRLRTADNRVVVMPNSSITTAAIINFSAYPRRRIDISITLDYRHDPRQARAALLEVASATPGVLDDPAPSVAVSQLADAGTQMTLFAWAKTYELGDTRSELVMAIRERMDALGMSLASAPRDIRLLQDDTQAVHPPA
ncbi:mechanosensitive ion channel family protein [Luteimonas qiangzhengi]|uniref:mechanosensitive ion channel family protein n=1 Tax=Luteimonas sp. MJ146 TaxID=3129240 RepID=UPI0031BAD248